MCVFSSLFSFLLFHYDFSVKEQNQKSFIRVLIYSSVSLWFVFFSFVFSFCCALPIIFFLICALLLALTLDIFFTPFFCSFFCSFLLLHSFHMCVYIGVFTVVRISLCFAYSFYHSSGKVNQAKGIEINGAKRSVKLPFVFVSRCMCACMCSKFAIRNLFLVHIY